MTFKIFAQVFLCLSCAAAIFFSIHSISLYARPETTVIAITTTTSMMTPKTLAAKSTTTPATSAQAFIWKTRRINEAAERLTNSKEIW